MWCNTMQINEQDRGFHANKKEKISRFMAPTGAQEVSLSVLLSVSPWYCCILHSIFIILVQIFKLSSQQSHSSLSAVFQWSLSSLSVVYQQFLSCLSEVSQHSAVSQQSFSSLSEVSQQSFSGLSAVPQQTLRSLPKSFSSFSAVSLQSALSHQTVGA